MIGRDAHSGVFFVQSVQSIDVTETRPRRDRDIDRNLDADRNET